MIFLNIRHHNVSNLIRYFEKGRNYQFLLLLKGILTSGNL